MRRIKGLENTKNICLKSQEMLSFGSTFKFFLAKHNHPNYTGWIQHSHTRFAARKCQITKSPAFETKYYGHRG